MNRAVVIDEFLDNFAWFRGECDGYAYEGTENPEDGVFYPGIYLDVPPAIQDEVFFKFKKALGVEIESATLFLRLTVEGEDVPHQAHTDTAMGDFGLILYMNREADCQGGTAFVSHVSGMDSEPENEAEFTLWMNDHNRYDQWDIAAMVKMRENRALLFDTRHFHRAEEPNAYGENAENGRLVLVCFITVAKDD